MSDADKVLKIYGDFREDVAKMMIDLRNGEFFVGMPMSDQLDMAVALNELIRKHPGTCDIEAELGLVDRPDILDEDDLCTTECGCYVELDGHCEHGNPSKALEMGLV